MQAIEKANAAREAAKAAAPHAPIVETGVVRAPVVERVSKEELNERAKCVLALVKTICPEFVQKTVMHGKVPQGVKGVRQLECVRCCVACALAIPCTVII